MAREESGNQRSEHQAAGRPVRLPGWQASDAARARAPREPRLRQWPPLVRHVVELLESDDRANRAVAKPCEVLAAGVHASEEARREGRSVAPSEARREAHQAHERAGRVSRRAGRWTVQTG